MPGEGGFDNNPAGKKDKIDFDAPDFRDASVSRVSITLNEQLAKLRDVLQGKNPEQIKDFIIRSANSIDRSVLGATDQEDISSTSSTAILHATGIPIWNKPSDTEKLETEILADLATRFVSGQIDTERLGQGVYFLQVLLHKYKNGNGRTARALKFLLEKSNNNTEPTVSETDTKAILGIDREGVTQTGKTTYKINFNPDFERLVLGVAYFGLNKGLDIQEVTEKLRLNGEIPEQGLDTLARRLNTSMDHLKNEYIRFMAVGSDLSWCDFKQK